MCSTLSPRFLQWGGASFTQNLMVWFLILALFPASLLPFLVSFGITSQITSYISSLVSGFASQGSQTRQPCVAKSVAKLCPTLHPHKLQHARLPCPPLSPGVCSSICPLSRWWFLAISSSAALFFCLQSFSYARQPYARSKDLVFIYCFLCQTWN